LPVCGAWFPGAANHRRDRIDPGGSFRPGIGAFFETGQRSGQPGFTARALPATLSGSVENFGDQEYLYVVVEVPDAPDGTIDAEAFAASLAARLRTHPEHVDALYYRITADDLGSGVLYYSSLDEAAELSSLVAALGPELSTWLQRGSLVELVVRSSALLDGGGSDTGLDARMLGPALAALEDFGRRMDDALMGQPQTERLFDVREGFQQYFYAGEQQLLIMRILPVKDYGTVDVIAAPLATIRQELAATRPNFPMFGPG
jgi:uncharacterized protein